MGQDQDGVSPTLGELADSLPPQLLRFVEALARVMEERDWLARQRRGAASAPGDECRAEDSDGDQDRDDHRPQVARAPSAAGAGVGQMLDDHGDGA
jgi:hypothetical protein